jgi:hypothetical protein
MVSADYLIVGAGALGMAFADEMLSHSDASMVIVDRHHMAGGHWNDAYPFVRLHQPSAFYGVGSRQLGSNRIDEAGPNKGYYEQASGAEVLSYFDGLMRERLLPSGRVKFFPMSEHEGEGRIRSLLSGETTAVDVRRKIVDATYFQTSVPSTHERKYDVAEGVRIIPPNALPSVAPRYRRFAIVGAGKTGMDVGVWLLQAGAAPESIRWIVPRDSWLINREMVQPGDAFYGRFMSARAIQLEAAAEAASTDDLFARLERGGQMLRIDPSRTPTMYHGATIAVGEVEILRTIRDVVRMGHVRRIGRDRIELAQGEIEASPDTLYIDCTASAFGMRPARPVFEPGRITIQVMRANLFSMSAASIAIVEAKIEDEAQKNRLCAAMGMMDTMADWAPTMLAELEAQRVWAADPVLRQWLGGHRLTGANLRTAKKDQPDPEAKAIRQRLADATPRAVANLQKLVG